ncbi:glycosyltransferase [Sedimentibacter sp. B4]|uniref:glycosyltransferase n=1 Tax=Sedimentibacter sp. B4 TaxID=304766 RepID=UPI0002E67118|nr:glycosyltransferase [Sedimentibacter sp. B4]
MKKLFIFIPVYLPGVKGGGPIRSIEGLAYHLKNYFDIYIFTSDKDLGDKEPYEGIDLDKWITFDGYNIYYSSGHNSLSKLVKNINNINPDFVYINGFFNYEYSIKIMILRKLGLIKTDFVLAPRGEFSKGALYLKRIKKSMYINLAKVIGLYNSIKWQASSEHESEDIRSQFPNATIKVALNLSKINKNTLEHKLKENNILKLVFLSRISPKKNLKFALETLVQMKTPIEFDIFGPIENEDYWSGCKAIINRMPSNITIRYKGIINNENVLKVLSNYDFFFFPTLGENYGHVIKESLSAGTPVIISDQTPWKDLVHKNIGYDISGFDIETYSRILYKAANISTEEHKKMIDQSKIYAEYMMNDKANLKNNIDLFDR